MARSVEIWRTGGGAYTDYTAWLCGVPGQPLLLRKHDLNQPQTCEFYLTDGVASLVVPEAGNRVRIKTSGIDSFFTGYLLQKPQPTLLGGTPSTPTYSYKCVSQDESLALEWAAPAVLPTLPPFIGKTQGQIVASLISALGSSLGVSYVDAGTMIAYFRVKPEEGFWDAVRRLSDRTNMAFWVSAGECFYQRFDNTAFGYVANESDPHLNPHDIGIKQVDNPVYNDVVAVGDPEPQAYVAEHFVADGLTGAFALKVPMYGAESSKLLEDDFTGTTIDSSRWLETDPDGVISATGGSLRFNSGASASNNRLTALLGLEMAGTLELRAGRIKFGGSSTCLIGGIFSSDTGLIAQCLAGFRALKTGGTTRLQAVVNGAVAGPTYDVLSDKTYQFVLTVTASQFTRLNREFFSAASSYGGDNVASGAVLNFAVTELSDSAPDNPLRVLTHSAALGSIAPFAYYTLIAGPANGTDNVDLYLNFTSLRVPPQARLSTKKTTDADYVERRLGDKGDPEAWAAVIQAAEGYQVQFFADRIPDTLERIRLLYRQSGLARARVYDATSVALEATRAGDSGRRTFHLPTITPAPRNAAELELAIQAFIDDHTRDLFEGAWQFNLASIGQATSAFQTDAFQADAFQVSTSTTFTEPVPGRFLIVSCPTRFPAFSALVTSVELAFNGVDSTTDVENVDATVRFGQLRRFDQIRPLDLPEEALVGPNDSVVQINQTEFDSVGDVFSRDVGWAVFDGTIASASVEIDAGTGADASFEVRKTDAGWASAQTLNYVSGPTAQVFTVPRSSSDTTIYVKNKDASGRVSRYPSVVRVVYPGVPPTPTGTVDASNPLSPIIRLGGENADVARVEVRAEDNSTVLFGPRDVLTSADLVFPISSAQASLTFYCYYVNLLGEYSAALNPTVSVWGSSHVSYRPLSDPLTATDAGASATVNIASFTMRSGLADVNVSSGSISSLSFNTLYYIYYDDAEFAGGAVTYNATATKETALAGGNRYFVGSIITPRDGAPDTIGNNDGGSGAQIGMRMAISPILSDSQVYSGGGTISNVRNSIDGNLTTYASISGTADGVNFIGGKMIFYGPAGIVRRPASAAKLKVRYSIPTNSLNSGLADRAAIRYNTVGNSSFGATYPNIMKQVNAGVTAAEETLSSDLSDGINFGQIVLLCDAFAAPVDSSGSIELRVNEVWIEVEE